MLKYKIGNPQKLSEEDIVYIAENLVAAPVGYGDAEKEMNGRKLTQQNLIDFHMGFIGGLATMGVSDEDIDKSTQLANSGAAKLLKEIQEGKTSIA